MTTILPQPFTVNGRYEITERPLGEGGMGVIYKAYDVVTKRFVALKTIWAEATPATNTLFEREWTALGRLSHPNIVDILDTGEWTFNGQRRPYFVMPLLPGRTLEEIIKYSSQPLTVDRTIDIIAQACRGLQAAHDQNLVHRDIKPSNIFVMDDDTVKIIDFGVAQLADAKSGVTNLKGTPLYMAPEQLELKPATALSDIFSLAVVCYETLTGRKPFARDTAAEIAEAVRSYIPPAASEINPAVNQLVSRTVHKAMAKQPWHRFINAREFGDTLQKALRNEAIERFERSKILPRIERVKKAYSDGDHEFALEILRELESEGHVDPDMSVLHIQIDRAVRQENILQLLENARIRLEEEEFPLALHKVDDALALDPSNADALALKQQIESRRDETQLAHWFRLVHEHLNNNLFGQARQDLEAILKIDSSNTEARQILASIDETEKEILKNREEKQHLYENALQAHRNGELNTALTHLERAIAMARRTPRSSSPELDAQCQAFYDSVRHERDSAQSAYQEGRNLLVDHKVAQSLAICEEYLTKHPRDARFQALKLEAEEIQRHEQTAAIAVVSSQVEAESDLDQKYKILQDAVAAHPAEPHFRSALKLIADRRDLVNAIVARAHQYEERGQFSDAISEMDILRNIYPSFPGFDAEMQRLAHCQEEESRFASKSGWIEQLNAHLNAGEYDKALALSHEALAAFPADDELLHRQSLSKQGVARNNEANALLKEGQDLCAARNYSDGLASLRKAERLDPRNRLARAALLSGLVSYARELVATDWHAAEPVVKEALDLEPTDPVARSLLSVLDDNRRQSAINIILAGARNYQADGHLADALQIIERGLVQYPNDHRLVQFFSHLRAQVGQAPPTLMRPAPLDVSTAEPEPVSVQPDSPPESPTGQALPPPPPELPAQPQQNFFAPPTTDIPPKEPLAESVPQPPAEPQVPRPAAPKAMLRPGVANRPPRRPIPPRVTPPLPVPYPRRQLPERIRKDADGPSFKGPLWVVAVLCALALILSAGIYQLYRKSIAPATNATDARKQTLDPTTRSAREVAPVAARFPVSFESNIANTRFTENGQPLEPSSELGPGNHIVEASREGYLPEVKTFTVDPAATDPLNVKFALRPILPLLRVTSSITHGHILVDETESLDLQAGVAAKEDLAPGTHTVKIFDGRRQVFAFAFEAKLNEIPSLLAPLAAQPEAGVIVSSLSGSARIYATDGLRASAAAPVAPIPPLGLVVSGSASNPAHFLLDSGRGKGPQEQSVDPSIFPTLKVQLAGAPEATYLAITVNAANCQIFVDGKPLLRNANGDIQSVPLDPGNHPVRLSCPGFQDLEKVAIVKPGEVSPHKLDFAMTPVPEAPPAPAPAPAPVRHTQLTLTGAPPDTPVFQNQVRIGTVGPDGVFSREIEPGTFTWEWRKPGYEPRHETRTVKAGDSVQIEGAMVASTGTLRVKVVPDGAQISVRRQSDNAAFNPSNNMLLALSPGVYAVTAQAPQYRDKAEFVTVPPGKIVTVDWGLEKLPLQSVPVRFFENGEFWTPLPEEEGWWIHSGSGYSSLRSSTGVVSIDFLRKKRSRKINMLADCRDHSNCIVYSIDGHNFTTKVVSNGETVSDDKKAHGMDGNSSFHLVFEMSPDAIVVKNHAGAVLSHVDRKDPHGKLTIQDDTPLNLN